MRLSPANRWLSILLIANLTVGPLASAQQSSPPPPAPTPDASAQSAQPPNKTGPSFESKLAADASAVFGDVGDYVPCEFSRDALLSLRPTPDVLTLTAKDEDELRTRIIAEAQDSSNAKAFPKGQTQRIFL